MSINISALQNAINSLESAIVRSQSEPGDDLLRDGVIQRFEYTFELCFKMLKRILESMSLVSSEIDSMSYKSILREAFERGLIQDVNQWIIYRHQRNLTSHTYNEEKAKQVYQTTLLFIHDAKKLYQKLDEHTDD
jgi:nucleotidyltransferase substrate binding protein (TIGR01987 family)